MDGLPTVDCFVVNDKGTFRQPKSDFSWTVDGVFVLEWSTECGVIVLQSLMVDGVLLDLLSREE